MFSIDFDNLDDAAFEKLKMEAEKDVKLTPNSIADSSIASPKLYMKYLNLHTDASRKLRKAMILEKQVYKKVWEYYNGKSPDEVYVRKPLNVKILKTDMDKYIDTDSLMVEVREKVDDLKKIVAYLEKVMDQLKNRNFIIKNLIDYEKFKNGGY